MSVGCDQQTAAVAQAPPPPVNVAAAISQPVQEYDEFTGRVAATESVEVRSRVAGYIESIGFKDGDEVKKGQVLFQIDPRPFKAALDQAKAERKQAQAESNFGNREVERLKPLLAEGAATPKETSEAQDKADRGAASIAKADAEIESKQLDLDYASVKSPIDGRVSKTGFSVGNLVGGDTLLTTVVSITPIWINFDVDERRMLWYQADARKRGTRDLARIKDANIAVFASMANESDFTHRGVIDFVDNQVDPLTGTIRARAEFDNAGRIFTSGQFVRVRLPRGDLAPAVLVPDRAIGRDQDRKYVLVVNDKNVVEYRQVETGNLFGEDRAILSGLKADERIVVDGMQRARPGTAVTPTLIAPTTQPATSSS